MRRYVIWALITGFLLPSSGVTLYAVGSDRGWAIRVPRNLKESAMLANNVLGDTNGNSRRTANHLLVGYNNRSRRQHPDSTGNRAVDNSDRRGHRNIYTGGDLTQRDVHAYGRRNRQHRNSAMDGVQRALHRRHRGCGDHDQVPANGNSGRAANNLLGRHDCGAWREHSTGRSDRNLVG
jgi:hypothetical protein